jgi:hypothetical protein
MKVTILYRSNSEQERSVKEFEIEYARRTGRQLAVCDLNTQEGVDIAELYGIVQYPAVLATAEDGAMLQLWQGNTLPLMNEVMYYDKPA